MATYGPDDVFVILDGYDISGETYELGPLGIEAMTEESRGFGDAWSELAYIGVKTYSIEHRSRYDDALLKTNAALVGTLSNRRVLLAGMEGNTKGKKVVVMNPAQASYAREPAIDGLTKIAVRYAAKEVVEDYTILQQLAALTAAGATAAGSTNNGASSANGGRAVIAITNLVLGGYTSLTVTLQESSNDGGGDAFATKVTLATAITAAPFSAIIPITGTIEQYTRVFLTWNGAGSGQSVSLIAGLIRA